jgi:RNA polymerase sigma-70 factor (ECF subfamily)
MSHQQTVATLYATHAESIRRYFYRRIYDAALAEDLCNDVFVRVLEGLPNYHDRGLPIEAWLYRIAHDKAVDAIRYMARRPQVTIQEYTMPTYSTNQLSQTTNTSRAFSLVLAKSNAA